MYGKVVTTYSHYQMTLETSSHSQFITMFEKLNSIEIVEKYGSLYKKLKTAKKL